MSYTDPTPGTIYSEARLARATEPTPVPLLDVATIVGGGMLSMAGLLRGGLRGWLSTSLGALLIYRGVTALQEHAVRQGACDSHDRAPSAGRQFGNWPSTEGAARTRTSLPVNPAAEKATCVAPGIIAPG